MAEPRAAEAGQSQSTGADRRARDVLQRGRTHDQPRTLTVLPDHLIGSDPFYLANVYGQVIEVPKDGITLEHDYTVRYNGGDEQHFVLDQLSEYQHLTDGAHLGLT